MSMFNLFNKKELDKSFDNNLLGPLYLEGFAQNVSSPKNLRKNEWRRKLKSSVGNFDFRIKYSGRLHDRYNTIVSSDSIPVLIVAEDPETKEEIVLFDGQMHGYNALFCDTFDSEAIRNDNTVLHTYGDVNEVFEIIISTYYGFDYDQEFAEEVDSNGMLETVSGSMISFETAKRNGFDSIQIMAISQTGKRLEILSEELS